MLEGDRRRGFLVALASELPLAARGEYAEAGHPADHALAALRAVNEMSLVVAKQLRSSLRGHSAYPDDAFLQVLEDHSIAGDCERVLCWSLERAVQSAGAD